MNVVAALTCDADPLDFAKEYEAKFGRVILAYVRPNKFLTNHGFMTTESLTRDVPKVYPGLDVNPIAIVANVAQRFLELDRAAKQDMDRKFASDSRDILFYSLFDESPQALLDELRQSRWRHVSTSSLYSYLEWYSEEDYHLYGEDIRVIKNELARRGVTDATWDRCAPEISLE